MITIAGLTWDNWFSYGDNNYLSTSENKVTQITGANGSGKSSIPVIIGEILYGKNNLGKAKSKLFNRYLDKKQISANLSFYVDESKYTIVYDRKSTLKLSLYKEEIDISSHTATETYKTITGLLGYDFATFWGLIYQSSKDGLEFLTATDTTRKKFLVKLFNLNEYVIIHEFFKNESNIKNTDLLIEKGKLSIVNSWIETNERIDLIKMPILPIQVVSKNSIDKLVELKAKLQNIHEINKKINLNEQLKSILANLDTSILSENIFVNYDTMKALKIQNAADIAADNELGYSNAVAMKAIERIKELKCTCPTCEQDIDEIFKEQYIQQKEVLVEQQEKERVDTQAMVAHRLTEIREIINAETRKQKQDKVSKEVADLISKIDQGLAPKVVVEEDIQEEITKLELGIANIETEIKLISGKNLIAEAHNSKIKVISEQLAEYRISRDSLVIKIEEIEDLIIYLNINKKAFSPNGLISYKIENLSKNLEDQINIYLAELSKGRFQLCFVISGEKLNIDIIDDGNTVGIEELSAGELARVNTATLLAIRKLMAAISSNKINILFLDEITGVLDEEGKEVLIDILNSETELNTFLVSHEFTHPLIPQINIIKENKISKIEE